MSSENLQIFGLILERLDKIQEQQNLHQNSFEYLKNSVEEHWRIPNIHEKVLILQEQLKNVERNILKKVSEHWDQSGTVITSLLPVQTTDQHCNTELQAKETSYTKDKNTETSRFTDLDGKNLTHLSKVFTESLQEISSVANVLVNKLDDLNQKQTDMMKETASKITDQVTKEIASTKDELVKIVQESGAQTGKKVRTSVTELTQSITNNHEEIGQNIQNLHGGFDTSFGEMKETSESPVKSNELKLSLQDDFKQNIEHRENTLGSTRTEEQLVEFPQTNKTAIMTSNEVKQEVLTSRREGQENLEKCVADSFCRAQMDLEEKFSLLPIEKETNLAGIKDDFKTSNKESTDHVSGKLGVMITEMQSTLGHIKQNMVTLQQMKDCQQQSEATVTKTITEVADKVVDAENNIIDYSTRKANLIMSFLTPSDNLSSISEYTCDFYLEKFRDRIKSGFQVNSNPWSIKKYKPCVKGHVVMKTNGEMLVRLVFARAPREHGLVPRSMATFLVKATITDLSGTLPTWELGQKKWNCNETRIQNNYEWGLPVGSVNCQDLLDKGYGQKEGYDRGAILIRYIIKVL